jgi:hypothetical protein
MPTPEALKDALLPLCRTVAALDLSDPAAAEAALEKEHPFRGLGALEAMMKAAQAEGWLTPKRATPDLTFGRLAKATPETSDLSIDVVDMGGAGGEHVHPNGEVSLCFVQEGDPRFVGRPAGWVVVPPGSRHVPEVTGGRMLIAYFLPSGAIQFV